MSSTTLDTKLNYRGQDYPATRCGSWRTHGVFLLRLGKDKALVRVADGTNDAKVLVLKGGASGGTSLTNLGEIEWAPGAGALEARRWAADQCEISARQLRERGKTGEAEVRAYEDMASQLRQGGVG